MSKRDTPLIDISWTASRGDLAAALVVRLTLKNYHGNSKHKAGNILQTNVASGYIKLSPDLPGSEVRFPVFSGYVRTQDIQGAGWKGNNFRAFEIYR